MSAFYWNAALAAHNPEAVDAVREWLKESRLEDVQLTRLMSQASIPGDPFQNADQSSIPQRHERNSEQ